MNIQRVSGNKCLIYELVRRKNSKRFRKVSKNIMLNEGRYEKKYKNLYFRNLTSVFNVMSFKNMLTQYYSYITMAFYLLFIVTEECRYQPDYLRQRDSYFDRYLESLYCA